MEKQEKIACHIKAAEHLELAAEQHREAASCHEQGHCEKAAHHTLEAMAHALHAKKQVKNIVKSYACCDKEAKCVTEEKVTV